MSAEMTENECTARTPTWYQCPRFLTEEECNKIHQNLTIIKFLFISDCFESRILGEGEFQLEGPGEESDCGK